jgi:uncharacterized protein with HEPN domain
MLSDAEKSTLANILYFIDLIASFLNGYDYQHFAADLRTFHAVTRCLEIISEASSARTTYSITLSAVTG